MKVLSEDLLDMFLYYIWERLNLVDSFADTFRRHKDRRISEMRQRWRDSKFSHKRKY